MLVKNVDDENRAEETLLAVKGFIAIKCSPEVMHWFQRAEELRTNLHGDNETLFGLEEYDQDNE